MASTATGERRVAAVSGVTCAVDDGTSAAGRLHVAAASVTLALSRVVSGAVLAHQQRERTALCTSSMRVRTVLL